jgi:hypothetical protein
LKLGTITPILRILLLMQQKGPIIMCNIST